MSRPAPRPAPVHPLASFLETTMAGRTCCPIPAWPRYLGLAGTLPFFLLALASWPASQWKLTSQDALLVYAALILTCVGFMHLALSLSGGVAKRRRISYRWSILPAALGWAGLLLPPLLAVALLLTGYWLHYLQDRRLSSQAILPEWYLPMRFGLTTAASFGLLLGGLAMLLGGAPFPLA